MTELAMLRVRPELIAGLDEVAKTSGRSRDELAEEALAEYLEVQRWQIAGIEEAIRDADAGEPGTAHEDVAAWLDSWGTDHELPPPEPKS